MHVRAAPDTRVTRSRRRRAPSNSSGQTSHQAVGSQLAPANPPLTHHQRYVRTISMHRIPSIHAAWFNIVQEQVHTNLYKLLVAACLWNRTKGVQAWPVFLALVERHPSPHHLAQAGAADLATLLRPLGLQNTRAVRLISLAETWLRLPPTGARRYRKLGYPCRESGRDVRPGEVLDEHDPREGWEIAHLPGVGPYALDSFRIFHRDMLRGVAQDYNGAGAPLGFEPEWKRVMPLDKELKSYIYWKWLKEGWIWDPSSGDRALASAERMKRERARWRSVSPHWI